MSPGLADFRLRARCRRGALRLVGVAASIAAATLLAACDPGRAVRCAFADVAATLQQTSDPKRLGAACECVRSASSTEATRLVPRLLPLLRDARAYRRVYSGGGLIGFGEAGERDLIVAQAAMSAIRHARPDPANVAPIVTALIDAANAVRSADYVGLYGDPSTVLVALMELLAMDYHRAGLGPTIATELTRALPRIRNSVLEGDRGYMPTLRSLAAGVSPAPYGAGPSVNDAPAASAPTLPQPKVGRHGLTWGLSTSAPSDGGDAIVLSAQCSASPTAPMDQLYNGGCNPYRGDTLCTEQLPLLCLAPVEPTLAVTAPVPGTRLTSRAASDQICADAHGPGWRMAAHHDGNWGLKARAQRAIEPTRGWVAIADQPANCWDP